MKAATSNNTQIKCVKEKCCVFSRLKLAITFVCNQNHVVGWGFFATCLPSCRKCIVLLGANSVAEIPVWSFGHLPVYNKRINFSLYSLFYLTFPVYLSGENHGRFCVCVLSIGQH